MSFADWAAERGGCLRACGRREMAAKEPLTLRVRHHTLKEVNILPLPAQRPVSVLLSGLRRRWLAQTRR